MKQLRHNSRSGHAVVETALMVPWLFFLFIGVLDFGFYAYAAISVQHAARVAALKASQSGEMVDTTFLTNVACAAALPELRAMPNVGTTVTTCNVLPVQVVATVQAPGPDTYKEAVTVAVTYQTVPLIPIPGLMGRMTLTRTAQMRYPE